MQAAHKVVRLASAAGLSLVLTAAALVGVTGPASAAVPGLQIVSRVSAFNSVGFKSVTVFCPAGKRVIGTGFAITNGRGDVILDGLVPTATSVRARAFEDQDGTARNWSLRVFAVCARPLAGYQIVSRVSAFNSVSPKSVTAVCPRGKRVLGGGAELVGGSRGEVVIDAMLPGTTSVFANAFEDQNGTTRNWAIRSYAICANPLAGLEVRTATSASNSVSPKSQVVNCSAGRRVLSAGWDIINGFGQVVPAAAIPRTTSVLTIAFEDDDGFAGRWSLTARAICARP